MRSLRGALFAAAAASSATAAAAAAAATAALLLLLLAAVAAAAALLSGSDSLSSLPHFVAACLPSPQCRYCRVALRKTLGTQVGNLKLRLEVEKLKSAAAAERSAIAAVAARARAFSDDDSSTPGADAAAGGSMDGPTTAGDAAVSDASATSGGAGSVAAALEAQLARQKEMVRTLRESLKEAKVLGAAAEAKAEQARAEATKQVRVLVFQEPHTQLVKCHSKHIMRCVCCPRRELICGHTHR